MFVTQSLRVCANQQRTRAKTCSSALWNVMSKGPVRCLAGTSINQKWNRFEATTIPIPFGPNISAYHRRNTMLLPPDCVGVRGFALTTKTWQQKRSSPAPPAPSKLSDDDILPPKNLGIIGRFRAMYKQYWYVMVPVHVITSTGWLLGFYYLSKSGVDIPALLRAISISENIINNLKDSSMGHLAIAYMCYKVSTPIRYMVTVGGTTISIKYLAQRGYIKPIPSKEKMLQMYDDKKAQMKQGLEDLQDKATPSKERMLQMYDDKKAQMKQGLEELQDKATPSKERMMQMYDDKKAQMKQSLEDLQDKASSSISSKSHTKK